MSEIESFIVKATKPCSPKEVKGVKSVSEQMTTFENTGKLTSDLQLLKNALLVISPTSCDSERKFSDVSNFLTDKRMRLTDSTLDNLCFLKDYFKCMDKKENN